MFLSSFTIGFFSFHNGKTDSVLLTTIDSNGSSQFERFIQPNHVSTKEISHKNFAMFQDKKKTSTGSTMVLTARPFDEFFMNIPAMTSTSFDGENNDISIKLNKD